MSYVTSVERIGIEKGRREGVRIGRQEGLLRGIELGLELKFGAAGLALLPEIRTLDNLEALEAILRGLRTAGDLEALRAIYRVSPSSR